MKVSRQEVHNGKRKSYSYFLWHSLCVTRTKTKNLFRCRTQYDYLNITGHENVTLASDDCFC